jgi:hypothetical protein
MISHELATYLILKCDNVIDTLGSIICEFTLIAPISILIVFGVHNEGCNSTIKKYSMRLCIVSITLLISSSILHTIIPSTEQAKQIFSNEAKS